MRATSRAGHFKRSRAATTAWANHRIRRLLVAGVACAVAVVALGSTISYAAPPGAPTRGAAQGVFQAFDTGGSAIRAHNHLAEGVPAVLDVARIYPGVDGAEYCAQGWHVILLGIFDDPAFFPDGNKGLFDYLNTVDIRYVLDGVPLETQRTAIKRLTHPDPAFIADGFAVGFGAFLPPGALSVGSHELLTFISDPVFGDFDFPVGFTVVSC